MFRFQFYHDYYNEDGEMKRVDRYHPRKNGFTLEDAPGFEYLMVIDLNDPVGAGGAYKVVREEGSK